MCLQDHAIANHTDVNYAFKMLAAGGAKVQLFVRNSSRMTLRISLQSVASGAVSNDQVWVFLDDPVNNQVIATLHPLNAFFDMHYDEYGPAMQDDVWIQPASGNGNNVNVSGVEVYRTKDDKHIKKESA